MGTFRRGSATGRCGTKLCEPPLRLDQIRPTSNSGGAGVAGWPATLQATEACLLRPRLVAIVCWREVCVGSAGSLRGVSLGWL